MPKRKRINPSEQTELLVASGRRCCLCYGLFGDFEVKRGQIAHIDRDPKNNNIDNLVFLCLQHHDEFDSRTSQSKGLSIAELIFYKEVLHRNVSRDLPRLPDDASAKLRNLINSLRPYQVWPPIGLLHGIEIKKAVRQGFLGIYPFNEDGIGGASYTIRIGDQALLSPSSLDEILMKPPLILQPGEWALLMSQELISLPMQILGRLIPISSLLHRGILISTGTHIEPGFKGTLVFRVENHSRNIFTLTQGDQIGAIEFILLAPISSG